MSRGKKVLIGLVVAALIALAVWALVKYGFGGGHTPPAPHDAGVVDAGGANPDASNTTPTPTPPPPWSQGQPVPPGWTLVTPVSVGGTLVNGAIEAPYATLGNTVYAEWSSNLPAGSIFCSPAAQTANRWPTPPASDPLFQAPVGTPGTGQYQQVWVLLPGACIRH